MNDVGVTVMTQHNLSGQAIAWSWLAVWRGTRARRDVHYVWIAFRLPGLFFEPRAHVA